MSDESKRNFGRTLLLIGRIALAIIFLVAAYEKMKPQAAMAWSLGAIKVSLSMFAMGVRFQRRRNCPSSRMPCGSSTESSKSPSTQRPRRKVLNAVSPAGMRYGVGSLRNLRAPP